MSQVRKTVRKLAAEVATKRQSVPSFVPTVTCTAVGLSKSLKVVAFVDTDGAGGGGYIATDSGKVKNFPDVDGVIASMSKIHEDSVGDYTLKVETGAIFASKAPTDIVAAAESKIVTLTKVKNRQQAVSGELAASLVLMAGWDTGNAAQQARFAEVTAEKGAVDADVVALTDELARLAAIVAG